MAWMARFPAWARDQSLRDPNARERYIMRHADVKITRKHYIKMTPESSQRAMDSLEKLFTSLEQKK